MVVPGRDRGKNCVFSYGVLLPLLRVGLGHVGPPSADGSERPGSRCRERLILTISLQSPRTGFGKEGPVMLLKHSLDGKGLVSADALKFCS